MIRLFKLVWLLTFCLSAGAISGQEQDGFRSISVFENVPVNFNGETGDTISLKRLQSGRLVLKKVTLPVFEKGTDVSLKLQLRSNGDPWDKSGSCFVVTDPEQIDILDVALGKEIFPETSGINGDYLGVLRTDSYFPPVELLRFMTPFGVGHFSDEQKNPRVKYNRPVYVPKWEKEVVWEKDISELESLVTGTFYIGVWIDTWTAEGYIIDLSLEYSGRTRPKLKVVPLVNTIYYVAGQKIPDLFAKSTLNLDFSINDSYKNVDLYVTTTGHGGHSGGDEFIQLPNRVVFDNNKILDTIPWRDDCASFRRFNPSSGVWTKKDTAFAYNKNHEKEYREIEERLASSDLSRSNWCPGSLVNPYKVSLGDLAKGNHKLVVKIPATSNEGDQLNHWLVSAYLTYEE
ncbi:PNGase F N-terminal domain-containing protein [Maribacter sp. HTCC2170]|uniref:PNGase F N-terminal domain-containing protein n=1 Tax=Maribacter sp. (strain HTCC2170 / KCCM 42371) TaxID=313603 RepID=UPI0002EF5DC3|nr:PNGase F N-terminal domain-containing protein [Maribacter sp. HTCC2170]